MAELSASDVEQNWVSRLQSFYLLHDDVLAAGAADEALAMCPHCYSVYLSAMRIYASAGNIEKMMHLLRRYQQHFPEKPYPRDL
jgi:hypothetical protein